MGGVRIGAEDRWELRGSRRGGWIAFDPAPAARGMQSAGVVHHVAFGTTDAELPSWIARISDAGHPQQRLRRPPLLPLAVLPRAERRAVRARDGGAGLHRRRPGRGARHEAHPAAVPRGAARADRRAADAAARSAAGWASADAGAAEPGMAPAAGRERGCRRGGAVMSDVLATQTFGKGERGDGGRFQRQTSKFRDWVTATAARTSRPRPAATTCTSRWPARGRTARSSCASSRACRTRSACRSSTRSATSAAGRSPARRAPTPTRSTAGRSCRRATSRPTRTSTRASPCRCCGTSRRERIVNNESADIIVMLNSAFDEFADAAGARPVPRRRCAPRSTRSTSAIYEHVNNGVYRSGFASSQEAYEEAVLPLFETLDELDERLGDAALPASASSRRSPTGACSRRSCASTRCTSVTSSATCAGSSTTRTCRATCATSTRPPAWRRPSTSTRSSATTT